MIDDDIGNLVLGEPIPALDLLEADIWEGVATRQEATRISRVVVMCQAMVLALGLLGSIAFGSQVGYSALSAPADLLTSASGMAFAPSTLLLGRHT